jgi:ferrochelatase
VLSPHSLPERYVRRGDPYLREVQSTVARLTGRLGPTFASVRLGFQSQVGPATWLRPTTGEVLERVARDGGKAVTLCPLGFVSDHIETLHDLDLLYRAQAVSSGMEVFRVAAFNDDPRFIQALAQMAQGPTEPLWPASSPSGRRRLVTG